ncbi:MAG: ABC transporter permease [Bacteriovorax sp.]|nr:ABC transporter permease [Bacteriovorax sp.]
MILNLNPKAIRQKLELIYTITIAQMKSRYRKTFAGFLWVILNPILTFWVQALIFKHVLKINIENYYLFLLAGVIPWVFITSSLTMTVGIFVSNRPTLMAFKIDPWVFLISQLLDNFINFVVSYLILILIVDKTVFLNPWVIPLLMLTTFFLVVFAFFLSFLLATLNVFFRDTQFILSFVLGLAYFVTPIFYQKSLLPLNIQKLVDFNPLYIFIKPFQNLLWKFDVGLYWSSMLDAFGVMVLVSCVCLIYWRKKRNVLYFQI